MATSCGACLFFIAYMEGAANDKVLDVFNGCGQTIELVEASLRA